MLESTEKTIDLSQRIFKMVINYCQGEMAEWTKATVLKTVISSDRDRGFESHSLLQNSFIAIYCFFRRSNERSALY